MELIAQVRQPEQRLAARRVKTRHSSQRHLERDRHLALDLLGRGAGQLRNHLHNGRRGVGIGLDVDRKKRIQSARGHDDDDGHHGQAIIDGPVNQSRKHSNSSAEIAAPFRVDSEVHAHGIPTGAASSRRKSLPLIYTRQWATAVRYTSARQCCVTPR